MMSQITAIKVNDTTVVQYEYDGLGRRISTTYPDAGNYTNTVTYKTNSNGTATTNPNVLTLGSDTYTYQYDTTNTLYGINRNSEGLYHGFYFDSLGQLIQESLKDESETIVYEYDTGGNITSKKHYSYTTGTRYYYITNLEGDIVKIINQSGVEVVKYTYDGWGVPTVSGSLTSTLGQDNPFRFKGYYYDVESGMYYLGSRYYDPVIGRFISSDNVEILDGGTESVIGNNMFVYCFNNPILLTDEDGNWPSWATKVLIGTAVIATAAILTIATAGTGTALACFAVGALKGAAAGATIGAIEGGITGAVLHRVQTGSWNGAGTAALNGAADGYMTGAITGFITGGLTSDACFVAGTVILTVAGKKAIEEIQVGDKVWAWDEKTGGIAVKEVVETYINESKELIHVFVEGEEIITTPTHPFYSPTIGWTEAIQLRAGDILVLVNGEYVIVEKVQHKILESSVTVYNFQVEDYHTYYVGNISVLVHNICEGNWAEGKRGSSFNNAKHHFDKHGWKVGASTLDEYTRKAKNFANEVLKRKVKTARISGITPNIYRYYFNNKYIDLSYNGIEHLIVSFGKQK